MLKAGIFLLSLLFFVQAQGQRVTARLDLKRRDPLPRFLEYSPVDKGLVTLGAMSKRSSRYLGVVKYDELFNRSWSKQVMQQNGRNHVDLMTVLGEKVLVFISEYFPRSKSNRTSYTWLDLEGNIVDERKEISEVSNERQHRVDLKYTQSLNKKKLLCYKNLNNQSEKEKILYFLFDALSDEVQSGEIEIPFPDDKFRVRKILVSNNGSIYILGKYYRVNRIKSPDDFGFRIYKHTPGSEGIESASIDLEDVYINDLTFKVDRKENIFLAGFYSQKSTSAIIGTLYLRIDDQMEPVISTRQKFDDEFLTRFMRDKQIDRGKELRHFYLDNIVLRSDGGVLLIAEKYYTSYNSYLDIYGYWVDQQIHHYDDIIINSVSPEGELEWSTVAQKRQSGARRDNLSYLNVVAGASIFLLYEYQPRRAPNSLYFNIVDMEGEVSDRKILLNQTAQSESFFPKSSAQVTNSNALLVYYQEREKKYSIVKVDFD